MTSEQRKELETYLEQEIGDLLRAKQIVMDGYICREVEAIAIKLASKAMKKKHNLIETR